MKLIQNIIDKFKHYPLLVLLGFITSVGLGLFAAILEDIYTKDSKITVFDLAITSFVAQNRSPVLTAIFHGFTFLGNLVPFLTLLIIALAALTFLRKYLSAIILLATVFGGQILTYTIKILIQRSRPETIYALIKEDGFSFPSGHTFIAVSFWGVLGYLMIKNIHNLYARILIGFLTLVIVLGIGFSRIYLGVHWTSDVIASYSLSIVYCLILIFIAENHHIILQKLRSFKK